MNPSADLVVARPEGLYCPAGDFHIDPWRPVPRAVITHGHGVMYSYADRVRPADRWAIAAYIRALQLSRNTPVAVLTPEEQAKLGGARP